MEQKKKKKRQTTLMKWAISMVSDALKEFPKAFQFCLWVLVCGEMRS